MALFSFFSIPIWFRWSWSNACSFLKISGIMTHLSFIIIPSITTMSSQNVHYVLISCDIWLLFSGQSMMMYPFSHCKWSSCMVAWCNCCIDIHSGMFAAVCMANLHFMLGISASLFFLQLCLESQSVMNRSGPGLYNILTLIWCILKIHCIILCDSVATSLLKYCYNSLWSVIRLTFLAKQ